MRQWQPATPQEIDAYHMLTASLDPSFARKEREFYQARSAAQLSALAHQAWLCNEPCRYSLAKGYLELIEARAA